MAMVVSLGDVDTVIVTEALAIHTAVLAVAVLALLLIGLLEVWVVGLVTMDMVVVNMVVDMETLAVVNLVVTVEIPHSAILVAMALMLVGLVEVLVDMVAVD